MTSRPEAPSLSAVGATPDVEHLPDAPARARIREHLETNFLVEAGAGSGKTTALVERMLSLVERGEPVASIAAVTFTRKAAGELARRFREGLEERRRRAAGDAATASRLDRALREIDRAFLGTIHAFCARLLRERPLAAGIDPGFTEVGAVEEPRLQDEFWTHWLDDLHAREDPILLRLRDVGIATGELEHSFRKLVELSDVEFKPGTASAAPDTAPIRRRLLELLERARSLMPPEPLEGERDSLMKTVRRLEFSRRTTDWERDADLLAAVETMSKGGCKPVQKQWAGTPAGKAAVRDLWRAFETFVTGPAQVALEAWYAHRYAVVLEFLLPLRSAFEADRHRKGRLTFGDLLTLAVRLLREDPGARRELGERYRRLLVDEFQDTDPLQAEICLLLASDPEGGADWRRIGPRPGALFVVGDPKQSIYRFRRADIQVYDLIRERITASGGEVLELTSNFRSVRSIGTFVDAAFQRLLPARATREQAGFAPLNPQRQDVPGCGVFRYEVRVERSARDVVGAADAAALASWIARRIAEGERSPGDFLVVPYRKGALAFYARELERRNVPVTTSGSGLTVELELRELLVLLEALADPADPIAVVSALTGLFFGLDPAELWRHAERERAVDPRRKPFSPDRPAFDPALPVEAALAKLREWADLCRTLPLDAALARIVAEIGLLPLAVGGEMGETRGGSLVHALDVVGTAVARVGTDVRSAIQAIEAVRESNDVEAPLRPGREDAVRVMNLHKAKGLEAPVVVLPYPIGLPENRVDVHVERTATAARGRFEIAEPTHYNHWRIRAHPPGWARDVEAESRFLEAERIRVLYVAATRAREELVVAQCESTGERSPWLPLRETLNELATPLTLEAEPPGDRRQTRVTVGEVRSRIAALHAVRSEAAEPAYDFGVVTDAEQGVSEEGDPAVFRGGEGKGCEWGTIVHRSLATMGRGRSGASLRGYVRGLLLEAGRPVDPKGESREIEELMALLQRVRASAVWREIAGGEARWELTLAHLQPREGQRSRLVSGTVDALRFSTGGASRIVDWKTDAVDAEAWALREARYRGQVEEYGRIVGELTGGAVEALLERLI